jgi:hypothetical protein
VDNRKFAKVVFSFATIGVLIAAGLAVKRVKAQTTTVQPFTAIEVNTGLAGAQHGKFVQDGQPQIPAPHVYTKILAVRSDGAVSITQKWNKSDALGKEIFMRMVYNPAEKTKTFYDPFTQSVVHHPYTFDNSLKGGDYCDGTPDGQIEGFDVVLHEDTVQKQGDGEIITNKTWSAPKLGCYVLKNEIVSQHDGWVKFDITRSVTHIRVGEPDPWYFAEPAGLTERTPEEWKDELVRRTPVVVAPE